MSKLAYRFVPALAAGLVLLLSGGPAPAATVVECVDAQGRHSFRDHCPTGTREARRLKIGREKKKQPAGPDLDRLAAEHPITLFSVPECDACDLVRQYLKERRLPFTERDASADVAVQTDLKELSGALTVPVLSVDGQVLKGYNRQLLETTLKQAGYPTELPAKEKAAGGGTATPPLPPPPPPPAAP